MTKCKTCAKRETCQAVILLGEVVICPDYERSEE